MTPGAPVARPAPRPGIRRIVVRAPNWLGDVVMSTPGFRALRAAYPEAEIIALVAKGLVPILDANPAFDAVWPLAPGREGKREAAARLAEDPFDLGVVIPESISSALLFRRGRVRHVVGFSRDPLRRVLLHEAVPAEAAWGRRRLVAKEDFVLKLMAAIGAPSADHRLTVAVSEADEMRMQSALATAGLGRLDLAKQPPILLAPGASFGSAKCWPAESFAALACSLSKQGRPILLIGTDAERDRLVRIRSLFYRALRGRGMAPADRPKIELLAGALDLGALKALIRRAGLLVANDAGTRHLAAAFEVPSVIFFGPTSVAKTSRNLERTEILETEHDCRPCYRRECPIDHRCMTSISVPEATAAAERGLLRSRVGELGHD